METPRNADSPFDPASHTPDVILRSSDNVDFYVMKSFLAFSSPDVFGGMFTLPQAQLNIPSPSGLHIVPVTEDSKTLRILLLYCYPLDPHDEGNDSDVGDIARAVSAARKYAMDFTGEKDSKNAFFQGFFPAEQRFLARICRGLSLWTRGIGSGRGQKNFGDSPFLSLSFTRTKSHNRNGHVSAYNFPA